MQIRDIIKLEQPPAKVLELLNEQVEGFNAVKWRDEETGDTILHLTIDVGRLKLVKLLLEKGVDTNATDLEGCTPLCLACRCGRLDMVKVLVGHGADVRKATSSAMVGVCDGKEPAKILVSGITALACALTFPEPREVVHYLVAQGARADSTALALALESGPPTLQALLAAGTEGSFDSPLYQRTIIKRAREGAGEILGTLLKAGPQYLSAQLREQIVMEASNYGHVSLIRIMYEAGWRLTDVMWGRWLLFGASVVAGADMLEYLLFTVGCDPNGPSKNYNREDKRTVNLTVLHAACTNGTLEHLALLIWADADIDARDSCGLSTMAYALHGVSRYPNRVCKYLTYCGVDLTRVQPTAEQRVTLRHERKSLIQHLAKKGQQLVKEEGPQVQEEHERVVCGIQRRVRARVKATCRSPQDFCALLCAVRSEPAPLVSQTAVDRSIDRFYSQRDAAAQGVGDSMACSKEARTCPLSSVMTRDGVVAADGHMYARAAIKSWMEECLREDGVVVSPTTGQVMSSTILLPAWTVAV